MKKVSVIASLILTAGISFTAGKMVSKPVVPEYETQVVTQVKMSKLNETVNGINAAGGKHLKIDEYVDGMGFHYYRIQYEVQKGDK